MKVVSNDAMSRLHPMHHHPESPERLAVLLERFEWEPAGAARQADVLRCHSRAQSGMSALELLGRSSTSRGGRLASSQSSSSARKASSASP